MTPERYAEVKAVVAGAMENPVADRERYLAARCGEDRELRDEVESLLAASDDGDSLPGLRAAVSSAQESFVTESDSVLRAALERALGAQYEIVRKLQPGGMSAVYLVRDRALERLVAVKVLRPDLAEAPEGRERFKREARIAAHLSHPGIVPLHSFGEIDGIWYFVMGYVRGQSLDDRLRLERALPPADVRRILSELADALAWAHRHGVIHRDIKPGNVLLDDESGRTILADFGISKLKDTADDITQPNETPGTPRYMSPEQGLGSSDLDERSDIYSLGAVGYTMLAGREPFAEVGWPELLYWRLSHVPVQVQTLAPSAPEDLAAVVMRCLQPDRTARWPSAWELREALGRTSGASAPALPEPVRDLPSFGPYALLWAVAWSILAFSIVQSTAERALLLLVAILVPVGLLLHVWNIGRHGLGPLELARVALWPPEWWGMWWPRALRRPTDLWTRLPWQARLVRIVLSVFLLAVPAVVLTSQWLAPSSTGLRRTLFIAAEAVLLLGTTAVVTIAFWWTRRRGLSLADGSRVLFGATTPSPAWNRPEVSGLLRAPPGSVRPPDHESPADHHRAIGEAVTFLPAEVSEVGAQAAQAARRLLDAIEQYDAEIATLSRDASPKEVDRLESQLTALQPSPQTATDASHELRDLIRKQLEVVRRMHARCEALSHRRAHLFHLMHGLWAQLCLVRDAVTAGPEVAERVTDRLRGLCAEITEETNDIKGRSGGSESGL